MLPVLGVDTLNKRNYSGKAIPKYDNIVKTPLFDDDTSIYLPQSIVTEPPLKGTASITHIIYCYNSQLNIFQNRV